LSVLSSGRTSAEHLVDAEDRGQHHRPPVVRRRDHHDAAVAWPVASGRRHGLRAVSRPSRAMASDDSWSLEEIQTLLNRRGRPVLRPLVELGRHIVERRSRSSLALPPACLAIDDRFDATRRCIDSELGLARRRLGRDWLRPATMARAKGCFRCRTRQPQRGRNTSSSGRVLRQRHQRRSVLTLVSVPVLSNRRRRRFGLCSERQAGP
jgi:hypothetical protein